MKTETQHQRLVYRQPTTFYILAITCETLKSNIFDHFTNIMMEAACTLAVSAFYDVANLLSTFPLHSIIAWRYQYSITLYGRSAKKIQTQLARLGVSIPIFQTDKHFCPCVPISLTNRSKHSLDTHFLLINTVTHSLGTI